MTSHAGSPGGTKPPTDAVRRVLVGALFAALLCLVVSRFVDGGEPPKANEAGQAGETAIAIAPRAVPPVTLRDAVAPVDGKCEFHVADAETGARVAGARICCGKFGRTVDLLSLRLLGESATGDVTRPVSFVMRPGEQYGVTAGGYKVYQRGLGMTETQLGVYEVPAGGRAEVAVASASVKWPVELRIGDGLGAVPALCNLTIRELATAAEPREWRASPANPAAFALFLGEGRYQLETRCEGQSRTMEFLVRPTANIVDVKAW